MGVTERQEIGKWIPRVLMLFLIMNVRHRGCGHMRVLRRRNGMGTVSMAVCSRSRCCDEHKPNQQPKRDQPQQRPTRGR